MSPSEEKSHKHHADKLPDPFAPRRRPGLSVDTILATSFFRCWHILLFFSGWSVLITILNRQGHNLVMQSTLLTVVGTVLGFIISYRTTSSFERYNEGRRLWSQIILACRTFARVAWFHVPEPVETGTLSADGIIARSMVEKKSAINLLEAFAISVKHYLRGEDGIYYKDLYYLVKFLPAYALPAGIPSMVDLSQHEEAHAHEVTDPGSSSEASPGHSSFLYQRTYPLAPDTLPAPVTSPTSSSRKTSFLPTKFSRSTNTASRSGKVILQKHDERFLLPAHMPPKYHIFDFFPFSLLVNYLTDRGDLGVKGRKAARLRAKMRESSVSHNLPLEISLYLSSYVALLQERKQLDVPTTTILLGSIGQLVESLTGLERILSNPIPFSYSIHLWTVTIIYFLVLPFQLWEPFGWLTIPGTIISSFIFFGFIVAGEEIENPFGYDKNDLNLDHFTNNIIRSELRAITSSPPPSPSQWAFSPENDLVFTFNPEGDRVTPGEWTKRGHVEMQKAMNKI